MCNEPLSRSALEETKVLLQTHRIVAILENSAFFPTSWPVLILIHYYVQYTSYKRGNLFCKAIYINMKTKYIKWALGRYIDSTCITHDSHSSKVQHASISVPILGHIFNVLFAKLQLILIKPVFGKTFSSKYNCFLFTISSLIRLEHL